jgi:hypothetical protein
VSEKLLWTVGIKAAGGPQVSASGALTVDAYDKLAITVAAGATVTVDLGPGGTAMRCLLVSPAVPDALLTYTIGANDLALDAPVALLGGAVALAGSPANLKFKNGTAADADIAILVGRDATP